MKRIIQSPYSYLVSLGVACILMFCLLPLLPAWNHFILALFLLDIFILCILLLLHINPFLRRKLAKSDLGSTYLTIIEILIIIIIAILLLTGFSSIRKEYQTYHYLGQTYYLESLSKNPERETIVYQKADTLTMKALDPKKDKDTIKSILKREEIRNAKASTAFQK